MGRKAEFPIAAGARSRCRPSYLPPAAARSKSDSPALCPRPQLKNTKRLVCWVQNADHIAAEHRIGSREVDGRAYQPITMFDSITFLAISRSLPVSCI